MGKYDICFKQPLDIDSLISLIVHIYVAVGCI